MPPLFKTSQLSTSEKSRVVSCLTYPSYYLRICRCTTMRITLYLYSVVKVLKKTKPTASTSITDIELWTTACMSHMSVLIQKFPTRSQELFYFYFYYFIILHNALTAITILTLLTYNTNNAYYTTHIYNVQNQDVHTTTTKIKTMHIHIWQHSVRERTRTRAE